MHKIFTPQSELAFNEQQKEALQTRIAEAITSWLWMNYHSTILQFLEAQPVIMELADIHQRIAIADDIIDVVYAVLTGSKLTADELIDEISDFPEVREVHLKVANAVLLHVHEATKVMRTCCRAVEVNQ